MEKTNKKSDIVQFVQFCIVGVANTAVDWIIYFLLTNYLLISIALWPTAKAISFLIAVVNSYIFNTIWTFRQEYQQNISVGNQTKSKIFIKFLLVNLVGWGINYLVFKYTLETFNFNNIIAFGRSISTQSFYPLIAASAAAILWNFVVNKLWTFRNQK